MSKFNQMFNEVVPFIPEGYYLSKKLYSKSEAIDIFSDYFNEEIIEVEVSFVRFQFMTSDMIEEGCSKLSWCTCEQKDKNAQPCWVYGV